MKENINVRVIVFIASGGFINFKQIYSNFCSIADIYLKN